MNIYIAIDEDREIIGVGYDSEKDLIQKLCMQYQYNNPNDRVTITKNNNLTNDAYRYALHIKNYYICDFIVEIHESL
jgi:hypothetical protein